MDQKRDSRKEKAAAQTTNEVITNAMTETPNVCELADMVMATVKVGLVTLEKLTRQFSPWSRCQVSELKHLDTKEVKEWNEQCRRAQRCLLLSRTEFGSC